MKQMEKASLYFNSMSMGPALHPGSSAERVQLRGAALEVLEPNYYLLLAGTGALHLHSALRGIPPPLPLITSSLGLELAEEDI